jgi:hypothetical protein
MGAVAMLASAAFAEVTTERSASILVFPKVIADGTRDTIIQITNTSNSMVHAHCFYVNGALTFPEQDPGPLNPPLWTEVDFDIWLTKQQPTYWVVSEGRLVDPLDDLPCTPTDLDCENAGFDPGRVPPVVPDFTGELKCIEVDATGAPLSGNHLKGEATLVTLATGEVAKYNALGVIGNENQNGDGVLCLGGGVTEDCPNGAEYNACPQTWILNHFAYGAANPALGDNSSVSTDITVVPCEQNFETQDPTSVTIQFAITNEYEQTFSASTTVTCWAEMPLEDINPVFTRPFVGTDFVQTRMRPSSGTQSGFMVVSDEVHSLTVGSSIVTVTATNLHVEGERLGPDLITIPAEQIQ